eukprot:GGOE01049440.1.p1 GENE.GGOE01049440.1~~GGOE01049440.1.p1  ORF type:complete len:295 (-),score=81.72 GGOE01049440.1:340-1224(-)
MQPSLMGRLPRLGWAVARLYSSSKPTANPSPTVITDVSGPILRIGLNRPEKKNAFDASMILALNEAYDKLANDPALRVGLLYSTSDTFTSGLDLPAIQPVLANPAKALGLFPFLKRKVDPYGVWGRRCPKPVVVAVSGPAFTTGLELSLAADIVIADETAVFAQMEASRGIIPFGGALQRMPAVFGWHNAMRYILTGDLIDVKTAHRFGLVQEIVPKGQAVARATELAEKVAAQAPLAVQAAMKHARAARAEPGLGPLRLLRLFMDVGRLMASADTREAVKAMKEKRAPQFKGK